MEDEMSFRTICAVLFIFCITMGCGVEGSPGDSSYLGNLVPGQAAPYRFSQGTDDDREPNDTKEHASELLTGYWVHLKSMPGNPDWFYIDLEVHHLADDLVVWADFENEAEDLSLIVFDSRGVKFKGEPRELTGRRSVKTRIHRPDRVWVRVEAGEQEMNYTLAASTTDQSWEIHDLSPVCGDILQGSHSLSGFGTRTYRIQVDECSSWPKPLNLHARLTAPAGVTYQLKIMDEDYQLLSGPALTTQVSFDGRFGRKDSQVFHLKVSFIETDDFNRIDDEWQLDIRGGEAGF